MMTYGPLVSVVIPVYNGADYLEKALSSVVNQTHRPIEIVVVNDGSTDKTGEILESWYDWAKHTGIKFKTISSEQNMGAGQAIKTGFDWANGGYISYLASDDEYVAHDFLERQVHAMQDNSADWSYSRDMRIGPDSNRAYLYQPSYIPHMRFLDGYISRHPWLRLAVLFWRNPVNSSSLMVRAATYHVYGGWHGWTKNADCDGMFLMQWSYFKTKVVVIEGANLFYRTHEKQVSLDKRSMDEGTNRTREEMLKVMRDGAPLWLRGMARFFWWLR